MIAHCPLMKGECMTHLELDDGWIIERYSSTFSECHTIIHTGCEPNHPMRYGIRSIIKGRICIHCHKRVPDAVLGMLRLCNWRP